MLAPTARAGFELLAPRKGTGFKVAVGVVDAEDEYDVEPENVACALASTETALSVPDGPMVVVTVLMVTIGLLMLAAVVLVGSTSSGHTRSYRS